MEIDENKCTVKENYSSPFHYIYNNNVKCGICRSCENEKDPDGDITTKRVFKTELFKMTQSNTKGLRNYLQKYHEVETRRDLDLHLDLVSTS